MIKLFETETTTPESITKQTNYYEKYLKYKQKYLYLQNNIQNGGISQSYSRIYVYNKLNNVIERINYNKYDNKIHIYVDDKKLEKIAIKNDKQIKKIISSQENYKNKFYHVSINEFEYPIIDKKEDYTSWLGNGIYKNPKGIWISCGLSWQKFIGNRVSNWSLSSFIYDIEPSETILYIKSVDELKKFINEFKKNNVKMNDVINWKKVKNKYDGLIICPYLGNDIWGKNATGFGLYGENNNIENYINKLNNKWKNDIYFTAEWYRHWEEASGVIWKPSTGIKSVNLISKINIKI